MKTMKKTLAIFLTAALIMSFIPLMDGSNVHAAEKLKLDTASLIISGSARESYQIRITDDSDAMIKEVKSDNEDIAYAKVSGDPGSWVDVNAEGVGSCTITVIGTNDQEINIPVKVTTGWAKSMLKSEADINYVYYGNRKIEINAFKGATGTLKVGSDKYTFKALDKSGRKTITLKKVYKLNTKVTCEFKWKGAKYTKSRKIISWTDVESVTSSKKKPKKVAVSFFYLHKDDTVKLKYGGKTYQKKVTKDYDKKSAKFTFTLKKKLKKNSKITFTFYNKYKQKLGSETIQLKNWDYDISDEDVSEE